MSGDLGDALEAALARPDGPRPANPFLRMVAWLLDQVLVGIGLLIIGTAIGAITVGTEDVNGKATEVRLVASWFGWTAFGAMHAYQIVGIAMFGTTLGRWICGLRIRSGDDASVGWGTSVLRHLVLSIPLLLDAILSPELASTLGLVVYLGLLAPALSDPERRGVHDRLVGTRVEFTNPVDALRNRFPMLDLAFRPKGARRNMMGPRDTPPDRSKED